jgi:hypothetical protein
MRASATAQRPTAATARSARTSWTTPAAGQPPLRFLGGEAGIAQSIGYCVVHAAMSILKMWSVTPVTSRNRGRRS